MWDPQLISLMADHEREALERVQRLAQGHQEDRQSHKDTAPWLQGSFCLARASGLERCARMEWLGESGPGHAASGSPGVSACTWLLTG